MVAASSIQQVRDNKTKVSKLHIIKLIEEQLSQYGLAESVKALQSESKVILDSPESLSLKRCIRDSDYEGAISEITKMSLSESYAIDHDTLGDVKRVIFREQFIELLHRKRTLEAVAVLRELLGPLCSQEELHGLSKLLVIRNSQELHSASGWSAVHSKRNLLSQISGLIPSAHFVPSGRLEALIRQAIEHQTLSCDFHMSLPEPGSFSIFKDHKCSAEEMLRFLSFRPIWLENLKWGEIWSVQFSNSGSLVACSCSEKAVFLFEDSGRNQWLIYELIIGLPDAPVKLSFSPDDSYLFIGFVGGSSGWIWDIRSKSLRWENLPGNSIAYSEWVDVERMLAAEVDGCIWLLNVESRRTEHCWQGLQTHGIAFDRQSHIVFAAKSWSCKILRFSLHTKLAINTIDIQSLVNHPKKGGLGFIESIKFDPVTRLVLVDLSEEDQILLVDPERKRVLQAIFGHVHKGFNIASSFGGPNNELVVSGSSDESIFVWHTRTARLLKVIDNSASGASDNSSNLMVNDVSWHPTDPNCFASASDSGMLTIWSNSPV